MPTVLQIKLLSKLYYLELDDPGHLVNCNSQKAKPLLLSHHTPGSLGKHTSHSHHFMPLAIAELLGTIR